jgi:eukaryotic-like serine/threonine-protein kinase
MAGICSLAIVQIPLQRLVQRPDLAPESGSGTVTPQFLVQTPAIDFAAMMSPDGRYFAYISFETGLPEIYVRPFPRASEGKWQVSSDGGTSPVWARSGRELFYLNRAGMLMSVAVQPGLTTFRAGTPTKLLGTKYVIPGTFGLYAVSPDGSRFLMLKETEAAEPDVAPASMVAVLNWFEELKHVQPR